MQVLWRTKNRRKWQVMFLLEKVKAWGKLDRRMSIAVVGCHYDEKKWAGQLMNKEKIRRSIKAMASVCKLQ